MLLLFVLAAMTADYFFFQPVTSKHEFACIDLLTALTLWILEFYLDSIETLLLTWFMDRESATGVLKMDENHYLRCTKKLW